MIVPRALRAMARTLLDEKLGCHVYCMEAQLVHAVKIRTLEITIELSILNNVLRMMQDWADYLDKPKE